MKLRNAMSLAIVIGFSAATGATAPAPGDIGPAGGKVFHVDLFKGIAYESSTSDQSPAYPVGQSWGCAGVQIGTSAEFGTGMANTRAAITAGCAGPGTAPYLADNFSQNGFDDWFLPAKAELDEMDRLRSIIPLDTDHYHYSSSEYHSSECDTPGTTAYANCVWVTNNGDTWAKVYTPNYGENVGVRAIRSYPFTTPPPALLQHISAVPGITGLETDGNQHLVSLVPLNNGKVVAAYRKGSTGAAQNWHMVFDSSGIVAAPRRTSQALDDDPSMNAGAVAPGQGRPAPDGESAYLALLDSAHNSRGGNFVRIATDGAVVATAGGSGSYHTQICPVGDDMLVTGTMVDQTDQMLVQWFANSTTLSWSARRALNGYVNEPAWSNAQCGTSSALGQNFVLLIRESTELNFELFTAPGNTLTPAGSMTSLGFPPGYTRSDLGTQLYAATGDDRGIVLFRGVDANGRKAQFYARFNITAGGVTLVDNALQPLPTSLSYETMDANITYGSNGQFFIAEYLAGNARGDRNGLPKNTRQAVRAYKINFDTGALDRVGEYEDTHWTSTYGSDDVYGGWAPLQDYSAAVSCDGNLYIGGTLDDGAGTAQLNIFKIPVKQAICGQTAPTVAPKLSGTLSPTGWLTGNASLDWDIDTHGLTETSRTGCALQSLDSDFAQTTYDCAVTTTAGTGTGTINVKRDATAPQAWTYLGASPATSGWFTAPVSVNFTGTDATSGIATCSDPVTMSTDGSNLTSPSGTCTDNAGNVSTAVSATGLKIDVHPPLVTPALSIPANALGWHKSAVVVSFTGTDAAPGSGIKTCTSAVTVSTDVTARSVTGTCSDNAGNSATANQVVNLDKVVPGITITRPLNGASYAQGLALSASFSCSDSRSGVASCVGTQATGTAISTAVPGSYSLTVDAQDRADNTSKKTSSYSVLPASFALSPSALSFGSLMATLVSAPQVITLSNTGQAALPLSSIKLTGTYASQFALTHACPSSIAAGTSCPINVSFKPTSAGSKIAAVTVTMNAGDVKVRTVSLSGTGVVPTYALSPTSLGFGTIAVGSSSAARTVTLSNTGTLALPIRSISITSTNYADFRQSNNCGVEVAAGASCQISVVFAPASSGSKTAKVTVSPGAGASTRTVSLSGAGSEPPISAATPLDIPTGLYSEEMAFDGTNLWVANPYGQSVSKIRVSDGALLANIGIGPYPRGIAFDGTDIWVTTENDNRIHRIRTSDGAVTLSVNVGAYPILAIYAGGHIWTVNHAGFSVTKLALNGTVIGTYPTVSGPHSVTTDGTYLYVASSGYAEISKLSLATGATVATITSAGPGTVSFDGSSLWKSVGDSLYKLDPSNGTQLLSISFGQPLVNWNQGLHPVSGAIWLADFTSGKIRKISLTSGAVLDEISQSASGPQGVLFAGGHLWVAMGGQSKVVRY